MENLGRWQNQQEATEFALAHPAVMLDLDMGCGKTRVAIDTTMERNDTHRILVVCPKAVVPVWRENLCKFATKPWECWDETKGTVATKSDQIREFIGRSYLYPDTRFFVVVNYDIVWRQPLGDCLLNREFDTIILDESHRAKSAGSKVSKYLAMLGRRANYRMCLSGTPMANSPLDVYGQYRFLDRTIFGTRHDEFLQEYAIMGGPEKRFIVGFKNQQRLKDKFQSIAYTCRMADIADRLKLPPVLPDTEIYVDLPARDMKTSRELGKEFVAECGTGAIVVSNVLSKMLRLQQIAAGFCMVQEEVGGPNEIRELNTAKEDALADMLGDISPESSVVVFCVFVHDLECVARSAAKAKRHPFEVSGRRNELNDWKKWSGGVLAVQIQAGAEGIDMTNAHHAIYFSLPHSLAQYNQSKARLYRPGQRHPVNFCHLLAQGTVDEAMYNSLQRKQDVVEAIKSGQFDFGYIR